jgi:MFS family permease
LVALCAGSFIAVVDGSIVSIAVPAIEDDLGFSTAGSQWVFNAYGLATAAMLLPAGRVSDILGARRVYLCGLVAFAVASLVAGLAVSSEMLLAGRAAQGLAAGAFMPAALSLIAGFGRDEGERNRALGANGAALSLGFVSGIILGGVLTDFLGWRSTLLLGTPLALATLALAAVSVPDRHAPPRRAPLDVAGAVLGPITVVALNLGIFLLALGRDRLPIGAASLVVCVVAGTAFVRAERRAADPLTPLDVFRNRQLVTANAATLLNGVGAFSSLFVLTYYYQDVRGASAWETSLLILPMAVTGIGVALAAGRLASRAGIRRLSLAGLILFAGGLALVGRLPVEGSLALVVLCSMAMEVGFVLSEVPVTIAGTTCPCPRAARAGRESSSMSRSASATASA